MANFSQIIFFFYMGERHVSQEAFSARKPEKKGPVQRFKKEFAAVAGALALGVADTARADEQDLFDAGARTGKTEQVERSRSVVQDALRFQEQNSELSDEAKDQIDERSKNIQSEMEKSAQAIVAYYDKKVSYEEALKLLEAAFPLNSTTTYNGVTVQNKDGNFFVDYIKVTPRSRANTAR